MTSYTETEIQKALHGAGLTFTYRERILEKLRKMKDDHVHDFADDDMISVKELKDAWRRHHEGLEYYPANYPEIIEKKILRDISEHREPEYPVDSVWRAESGKIWQRGTDIMLPWRVMGSSVLYAHHVPLRPLKRMDVIS